MSRPAARRDAGRDGDQSALGHAGGNQGVEVGRESGFQRGHFPLFAGGDVAQTIEHDQRELRVCFERQFGIESIQVHSSNSVILSRRATARIFRAPPAAEAAAATKGDG